MKITLPAGATVWSAALSGKPVKPGQAPDGSLLVPLEKARGGGEAPEFVVEIVYFTRGVKWEEKGNFAVTLPALDLPVSRTGLLVYYPPLFKVSAEPGIFRTETYENPSSAAFNTETGAGFGGGLAGPMSVNGMPAESDQATRQRKDDTRALADKFFAKSQGARATGILPIKVSFPAFGPSLFLVAELTSASQVPTSSLNYQRGKRGGAR